MKEEYVTGSYGIEGRYPFLDKEVVQKFLWLSADIKNQHYKSPLHLYMLAHNFPFKINSKVGFNCGFAGIDQSNSNKSYDPRISKSSDVGKIQREEMVVDFKNINKYGNEQVFYLATNKIKHIHDYCYSYAVDTAHLVNVSGQSSPYVLYEDGIALQHKDSTKDHIVLYGKGRYLHWTSKILYFSTSDNTNPITNGRTYKFGLTHK